MSRSAPSSSGWSSLFPGRGLVRRNRIGTGEKIERDRDPLPFTFPGFHLVIEPGRKDQQETRLGPDPERTLAPRNAKSQPRGVHRYGRHAGIEEDDVAAL